MENQLVDFTAVNFKKTTKLSNGTFQEMGNISKAKSKAISTVKKELEQIVIDKGAITTHAGFFTLIFQEQNKRPWAVVAYRPSFNFDLITGTQEIHDFLQITAPGLQL